MKILLSKEDMKKCDAHTITAFGMPSCVLMERAALVCVEELKHSHADLRKILVLCGAGNNGGDGFVIARLLYQDGIDVSICFLGKDQSCTKETKEQKQICEKYGITFCSNPEINEYTVIVDALFGIGLSRDINGSLKDWIVRVNESPAFVLSVDIPSGLDGNTGIVKGIAVKADLTVTFAFAQPGHYIGKGRAYTGKLVIRQIGITKESLPADRIAYESYEISDLSRLPKPLATENKGSRGKVLLIAGSRDMCGAAILSARAAYRSGAGYVKVYTDASNRSVLFQTIPEAVVCSISSDWQTELTEQLAWADAIAVGPGISMDEQKLSILQFILKNAKVPLILDADALNLAAKYHLSFAECTAPIAVTPHLGEMARLCSSSIEKISQDLIQAAVLYAKEQHLFCVLKDAGTIISGADAIYINTSGNSGMATAGSGDVLTGILVSLAAQHLPFSEALKLGVFLHGCAGDAAASKFGKRSMTAGDLIFGISEVQKRIS